MECTETLSMKSDETRRRSRIHGEWLPIMALLAAVLLWGVSFAAMRTALSVMNPWSVMWVRMATALILLLPLTGKLWPTAYRKGDWKLLIPMVVFQPCLYFFLESNALTFTTSSQAGVISAFVPIMVSLGAWLALSETVHRHTVMGLLLSVTGVILLTLGQDAISTAKNPLLGNSLEVLAMVSAAANMLIVKRFSARYNPWTLTGMQLAAGVLFFSPGFFKLLNEGFRGYSLFIWADLLFLGAFVTLGAFGLYNWAMSRVPATRASVFINLVPITAVIIGWLLMKEPLNGFQSLAAMLAVGGVWLSQRAA